MIFPVILLTTGLLLWGMMVLGTAAGFRRTKTFIPSRTPPPGDRSLTVIMPARNEERDIEESLATLLSQEGVELDIVVVDDHSDDSTGAIADRISAGDHRVKVIHSPPSRPGWLGKTNAMQHALESSGGELLLLTDADIMHGRGALASAIDLLEEEGADLFSLFPGFLVGPFWENAMLPMYFTGIALYLAPGLENSDCPEAAASGAFILVRRKALLESGGFEPVCTCMYDDLSLAENVKRHGFRTLFRLAPDAVKVEMFKTGREAFWGTTKNVLMVGKGGRPWMAVPALLVSYFMFFGPLAVTAAGLIRGPAWLAAAGVAVYLFQYSTLYLFRRFFRFHPLKALAFPLSTVVATACISRALRLFYGSGEIEWRGRRVKVR